MTDPTSSGAAAFADAVRAVLVADDHPLVRTGLVGAVERALRPETVLEVGDFPSVLEAVEAGEALDLVVLDLSMPGAMGLSGLALLRGRWPQLPVLIVTGVTDARVVASAAAIGASGYVCKSAPAREIEEALRAVISGDAPGLPAPDASRETRDFAARIGALSPQQFKVMTLIGEGLLNKQIAHELNLSISTVKGHVTELLRKLDLPRRTMLIAALRELAEERGEEAAGYSAADRP